MRPPVSIQTLPRSAKAVVNDKKTASAMYGARSGSVTARKRCQALRLSSRAYSKSSVGIALSPASRKTAVKEPPRHTLKSITLRNAQAPAPRTPSTACFTLPMKTL